MGYSGHNWVNDGAPAINATNLNDMDNELVYLDGETADIKNELNNIAVVESIQAETGKSYWIAGIAFANHKYLIKNNTNAQLTAAVYAQNKTTVIQQLGNVNANSENVVTLTSDGYYILIYSRGAGKIDIIDLSASMLGNILSDISDINSDIDDINEDITEDRADIAENSDKIDSLADANDCIYTRISRNLINMNFMEGKTFTELKEVIHDSWMIPVPINNNLSSGTKYRLALFLDNGEETISVGNTAVFRIYDTTNTDTIERIYSVQDNQLSHNISSSNYAYLQITDSTLFDYEIVGAMIYNTTENPTVATTYIPYEEGYVKEDSDKYITIGTGGDYATIKEGFAYAVATNQKVKILPGTYDLVAEGIESTNKGYILPKEVIGYGAILVCRLSSENWRISPLNVNDACPETKVYGLTVIAANCRYCIHDEMGESALDYYHNVFKDLKLVHESAQSATLLAPQSIGGGMGNGGFVEIDNCVCQCVYNKDISYHSYSHKVNGQYVPQTKDGTIIIKDSYIKGRPSASSISDYTSAMNTMYVSNCSLGENIQHAAATNMTLIDWGNVVRN